MRERPADGIAQEQNRSRREVLAFSLQLADLIQPLAVDLRKNPNRVGDECPDTDPHVREVLVGGVDRRPSEHQAGSRVAKERHPDLVEQDQAAVRRKLDHVGDAVCEALERAVRQAELGGRLRVERVALRFNPVVRREQQPARVSTQLLDVDSVAEEEVAAGEQVATGAGIALGAIVIGVVLSGVSRSEPPESDYREGLAVMLAIGAALFFGLGLFAMGKLSEDLPVAWIVFPSRLLAVLVVTVPLSLAGRLRMTREVAPLVAVSGLLEVGGVVAYTIGARHGIAVAAVLGSQFAAVATLLAFFLFRERLARVQMVGVVVIAIGVAVLTGLQAA